MRRVQNFGITVVTAVAMTIGAATMYSQATAGAVQVSDPQAYCQYVVEQATAQRDLLLSPSAVAGVTQPNTGLPMQSVFGVTSSLSNIRKSGLTMDAARKNCDLYSATTAAQQKIQYALPGLEKPALEHRLDLIEQASQSLDTLIAKTTQMVDAQNATRPMLFALQTAKIKLDADRGETQSRIASLYAPALSDGAIKDLVAEKQTQEANEQTALDKLARQNNWDVSLSVGAHQQIGPLAGSSAPYGEVTVSYNLGSRAIDNHLDRAADAYSNWKNVQEGDVVRAAEVLRQQVTAAITAQQDRLRSLEQSNQQIADNLQLVSDTDTSTAVDFRNQLLSTQLLLGIETGDATFRLEQLQEFLQNNY